MRYIIPIFFAAITNLYAMVAPAEVARKIDVIINGPGGPRCTVKASSEWTIAQVNNAACLALGANPAMSSLFDGVVNLNGETVLGTLLPEGHALSLTLVVTEGFILTHLQRINEDLKTQGAILNVLAEVYGILTIDDMLRMDLGLDLESIKSFSITFPDYIVTIDINVDEFRSLNEYERIKVMPAIIDLLREIHRIQTTELTGDTLDQFIEEIFKNPASAPRPINDFFVAGFEGPTTNLIRGENQGRCVRINFTGEQNFTNIIPFKRIQKYALSTTFPKMAAVLSKQ